MTMQADKERVRALLTETMVLLCKNSLQFKTMFSVEALIGITIDESEVILLRVNESIHAQSGVNASSVSTDMKLRQYGGVGRGDGAAGRANLRANKCGGVGKMRPRGGFKNLPDRSEHIVNFSNTKYDPHTSQSSPDIKPRFGSQPSSTAKRGFHNNSRRSRPSDRSSSNLDGSQNAEEEGNDLPNDADDADLVDASEKRSEAGSDTTDTITTNIKGEIMEEEDENEEEGQMNLDPDISHDMSATEDDLVLSCSTGNEPETTRPITTKKSSTSSGLEEASSSPLVIMSTGYPRMFICSECGKRSSSKRELQGHMASRHNQAKEYSCTECGKEFSYKRGLSQHYRNIHNMGTGAPWLGPSTGM